MTTQSFNLELIPQGVAPCVYVSQYDKGQTWLISLFENNMPFNIPSGASVTVQGTKPDSTGFQYPCTFSGNVVTATEEQQMTIIAGKVPCEIVITQSGAQIASLNFCLIVEPAALSDTIVISDTELPLIEEAAEAVEQIPALVESALEDITAAKNSAIDDVEEAATDGEAWARGTRNGVPVPSTDPTYQNNAKYYCDNSAGGITDAQWAQIEALYT